MSNLDSKDKLIFSLCDIILDYDHNRKYFTRDDIIKIATLNLRDHVSLSKGKKHFLRDC